MQRTTLRLAAALGVAAALGLAGCGSGGGDQSASAGAQATAPTTAAVTTVAPNTTAAPATTSPTTPTTAACGNVQFSSDSEDVATQITPTGMSCADAQALVRKVGPQLSSPTGPPQLQSDGFTCTRAGVRSGDHGAPLGTFECTNGAAKVVFNRGLVG